MVTAFLFCGSCTKLDGANLGASCGISQAALHTVLEVVLPHGSRCAVVASAGVVLNMKCNCKRKDVSWTGSDLLNTVSWSE